MAERLGELEEHQGDIAIVMGADGFIVMGNRYGSDELRAFSTPEGLIEWLSRELGAGPIVWSITYEIWAGLVDMKPDDLLPLPDHTTDPVTYQETIKTNAAIIIAAYVRKQKEAEKPPTPPKPEKKKARKEPKKEPKEVPQGSQSRVIPGT